MNFISALLGTQLVPMVIFFSTVLLKKFRKVQCVLLYVKF